MSPPTASSSLSRFAAFGFVMAFASSVGQTFFIGLFGGDVQAALAIGPGRWGLFYGLSTLCSGAVMFWAGAQADRRPVRAVLVACIALLASGAALLATTSGIASLLVAIFCLRFGGQGLSGHLAMVVAARAPHRRGRCLAIASLGFVAGEALLPVTVVALREDSTWRHVWWLVLGGLVVAVLPVLWWLGRIPAPDATDDDHPADTTRLDRRTLLRRRSFLAALTVMLVPPFTVTALFLQQASIVALRGSTPALFASGFLGFAASQALANWFSGSLVDRFGARALFGVYLVPLALALAALAFVPGGVGLWLFFLGLGTTAGAQAVVSAALWVELFGMRQVGLVRGVYFGFMVLSTAVSPFLLGAALSRGVSLAALASVVAVYALIVPVWAARRLDPVATG